MRFKKALCMTTLATLLFPAVQNIEYVDAAEYSIDIVVDTVEIDINDIPEDRCVKVGISLRNNPGMSAIFIPLEKDEKIVYKDDPPIECYTMFLAREYYTDNIDLFTFTPHNDGIIENDALIGWVTFVLPNNISLGDFYELNILSSYQEIGLCFYNQNGVAFFEDCFNITNGGIRIVGAESPQIEPSQTESPQTKPPQTEPPQTEPPQTEPPQTEPPQTEPPQTSTLSATSTIESTTITTPSITTTTNESTITTTESTTNSTTSVTTTSSASSVTTTTMPETSEVTENKNDKSKNNLPLILAVLASIGVLGGIIGFIIKKLKGHMEK